MTVVQFPRPAMAQLDGGITHAQAMEVHRRYFEQLQAVPTIAHEMGDAYAVACDVVGGKLWPGVREHWMDRVLP
ncbi:lipase chaperone [Variovorax paradoxus]|uniref:Uncharacterized protein n=1 Tax=Variovorax paradoxus (strain EPS) TaxID=595537 RepID=E6V9S1_VARPE|nr:lipase chaperone [Variovorax paradoxus]ADU36209.1 hypothetical protein Varpa_2001 [Variovorax paradoxus EPS]